MDQSENRPPHGNGHCIMNESDTTTVKLFDLKREQLSERCAGPRISRACKRFMGIAQGGIRRRQPWAFHRLKPIKTPCFALFFKECPRRRCRHCHFHAEYCAALFAHIYRMP